VDSPSAEGPHPAVGIEFHGSLNCPVTIRRFKTNAALACFPFGSAEALRTLLERIAEGTSLRDP
jgi:hypothetical protein